MYKLMLVLVSLLIFNVEATNPVARRMFNNPDFLVLWPFLPLESLGI